MQILKNTEAIRAGMVRGARYADGSRITEYQKPQEETAPEPEPIAPPPDTVTPVVDAIRELKDSLTNTTGSISATMVAFEFEITSRDEQGRILTFTTKGISDGEST